MCTKDGKGFRFSEPFGHLTWTWCRGVINVVFHFVWYYLMGSVMDHVGPSLSPPNSVDQDPLDRPTKLPFHYDGGQNIFLFRSINFHVFAKSFTESTRFLKKKKKKKTSKGIVFLLFISLQLGPTNLSFNVFIPKNKNKIKLFAKNDLLLHFRFFIFL